MATLLAAQLFFAVGLCGLVCCVSAQSLAPAQALPADSHANHQAAAESEESGEHCHAKKAERKAPPPSVVPAAQNCHGGKLAGQSWAASSAPICRCDARTESAPVVSLTQADSTQEKCAFASLPVWQSAEQAPPQPPASPPTFVSSPPPFSGHQLSLRI